SLRKKLKTNFGIQLPDVPDDEQWKPSIYFDSVNSEVRRQSRWEVDRDAAWLGFFTFSKFMMWRDLDATASATRSSMYSLVRMTTLTLFRLLSPTMSRSTNASIFPNAPVSLTPIVRKRL